MYRNRSLRRGHLCFGPVQSLFGTEVGGEKTLRYEHSLSRPLAAFARYWAIDFHYSVSNPVWREKTIFTFSCIVIAASAAVIYASVPFNHCSAPKLEGRKLFVMSILYRGPLPRLLATGLQTSLFGL